MSAGSPEAGPSPASEDPAEERDHFRSGMTVGDRYVLRRILGRGGAAVVFAAEHLFTRRPAALKLPHVDVPMREAGFERLRRELRALASVRHPSIVDVLDGGEVDGVPFIAMQLLEGRTLSGLITARGRLQPSETAKIGAELAHAMAAVHAAGVVHRDLKPSNVLIVPDRSHQARLLDFGTARLSSEQPAPGSKLTQDGAILGTPEYMAPEALLSLPSADHRMDVYSLGVTLYECLTGAVPFEGAVGQLLLRLTTSDPPALSDARPDVPKALAAAIHRSLRREAAERHATMAEFAAELAACAPRPDEIDVLDGSSSGRAAPAPPAAGEATLPAAAAIRREHARAPYIALARVLRDGGGSFDGRVEDISEGGVLLVAETGSTSGEAVRLRFALPISGQIVEISTLTRWSRASRGGRATGLEFTHLGEAVRAEIRQYVTLMGRTPARGA